MTQLLSTSPTQPPSSLSYQIPRIIQLPTIFQIFFKFKEVGNIYDENEKGNDAQVSSTPNTLFPFYG